MELVERNEAVDILAKMKFFQGQRAGRELWNDKPVEVQEQDLENFNRDIETIRRYILQVEEELKAYKDLEEQGLLLKLPCKAGDVVYYPSEYWKRVFEYAVIGICVYTEDIWIKCGNGYSYILGREIFLTKEEAEKALAEMEE